MPYMQNGVGKTAAVARLKGRGRTVLVFHTCVRSSWMEILDGIRRFARACDWRLQVVEHVPPREAIAELVEFWRPDGVIGEGGMDENGIFNGDVFGKLPVVYLMCDERNLKPGSMCVCQDPDTMGELAAREFLSLDVKSFLFFGFEQLFWSENRGAAFCRALSLNGCRAETVRRRFVCEGIGPSTADTAALERLVARLRRLPKPCGLFAANDMLADEALGLCIANGLRVPDDVAILGIDDDEAVCENSKPTLTSLRVDFAEAGYKSAELLAKRLSSRLRGGKSRRVLVSSVRIVRRGSTCLLPRANADVAHALELIRKKSCEGLRPRDVFVQMAGSRRRVEMRFRELTGRTVADEIKAVRLARAKELLRGGTLSIGDVAAKCGWKSPAQLRSYFVETEGVPPRDWLKKR